MVDGRPGPLWAASCFLRSAGYEVIEAGDTRCAVIALETMAPHFLVVGDPLPNSEAVELLRRARNGPPGDSPHVLLMTASSDSDALLEGLAAGADDFLKSPLVHAELLARLRAGARALEFARRSRTLDRYDPHTQLPTRPAMLSALDSLGEFDANSPVSLVVVDVDGFEGFRRTFGHKAAQAYIRDLVEKLRGVASATDRLYRANDNRFFAILADTSEQDAFSWAERVRAAAAEIEVAGDDSRVVPSVSLGVAQWTPGQSNVELVAEAEQALLVAKRSGRDRTQIASTIESITLAEPRAGVDVLRGAMARDVMCSTIAAIIGDESLASASGLFRQVGQCTLPVVDQQGKLLGTLTRAAVDRLLAEGHEASASHEFADADAPRFEEEITVRELYDFFKKEPSPRVEITSQGYPTGFVNRGTLAALGCPLDIDSFAAEDAGTSDSEYLLVRDLDLVEEAEAAV